MRISKGQTLGIVLWAVGFLGWGAMAEKSSAGPGGWSLRDVARLRAGAPAQVALAAFGRAATASPPETLEEAAMRPGGGSQAALSWSADGRLATLELALVPAPTWSEARALGFVSDEDRVLEVPVTDEAASGESPSVERAFRSADGAREWRLSASGRVRGYRLVSATGRVAGHAVTWERALTSAPKYLRPERVVPIVAGPGQPSAKAGAP
jgi:hypothetical protein